MAHRTHACLPVFSAQTARRTDATMKTAIAQSGVIPYRFRRGRLEIALVTASCGPHWTIPKGHVEEDLTPQDSAAKEAYEEAGLLGEVHPRCIGSYDYHKRGLKRNVRVYALEVNRELPHWPERKRRTREWLSADEAMLRVRHVELKDFILKFHRSMTARRYALAA